MLIKPVIDAVKSLGYFKEVLLSKDIPTLEELRKNEIQLPVCYLLPVSSKGGENGSDARHQQPIRFVYSLCLVVKADDGKCENEPLLTEAREKVIEALLGLSLSEKYTGLTYDNGVLHDTDSKTTIWADGFSTSRTYRKST